MQQLCSELGEAEQDQAVQGAEQDDEDRGGPLLPGPQGHSGNIARKGTY